LITIQDLKSLPGVEIYNLKFRQAKSVSTDSRSTARGEIFFALKGEKFDGHDFVLEALRKGAVCAIVDRQWLNKNMQAKEKLPLVVVDDTTTALGELALIHRKKFDIPVIAIGGSNGKTTVKEMIAKVLSSGLRVLKTEGNYNNQIGVPLTLFNLNPSHDVAVIEVGSNHMGEMERLCSILDPTAGLLTNIGKEHLEFFKNINGVKKEEGILFQYLASKSGTAFVNADDPNVVDISKSVKDKYIYGFVGADGMRKNVSGRLIGLDAKGCAVFEIKHKNQVELIHLKISGIHNASNALAASAVGSYFGLPLPSIKSALESFGSYEKRMEMMKVNGVAIVNDTYNSNPESTTALLRWLSMIPAKGKKIAVLADMLELGKSSKREHRLVGREVVSTKPDLLFTYGNEAEEIFNTARSNVESHHFADKDDLVKELSTVVKKGDVVVIKGSRGMKMEEVTAGLKKALQRRVN